MKLIKEEIIEKYKDVPEAKIPFFDFGNNSILNIYIPNAPILGNTNINLTTQDITTQSNIKALYKLGIDFYGMARRGSTWKGHRMIR
jgi:hypothetical protein